MSINPLGSVHYYGHVQRESNKNENIKPANGASDVKQDELQVSDNMKNDILRQIGNAKRGASAHLKEDNSNGNNAPNKKISTEERAAMYYEKMKSPDSLNSTVHRLWAEVKEKGLSGDKQKQYIYDNLYDWGIAHPEQQYQLNFIDFGSGKGGSESIEDILAKSTDGLSKDALQSQALGDYEKLMNITSQKSYWMSGSSGKTWQEDILNQFFNKYSTVFNTIK